MSAVLKGLPVDREIKAALLGKPSRLQPLYDLMIAQETGNWRRCGELATAFQVPEQEVAGAYLASVRWAREVVAP
jgi:c-di-GMP-related signal transduction protein